MKIHVLNREEILSSIQMDEVIDGVMEAFAVTADKKANIPLRTNISIPKMHGQTLYMPGYIEQSNASGMKIISIYPENIERGLVSAPSTMLLLDEETGFVKAILDGTTLTQLRTGAGAGAATKLCARTDCKIFLLIGTGGQAPTQLEAVLTAQPSIETVYVCDINERRVQEFAEKMTQQFSQKYSVRILPITNADDVVAQADIITTVTTAEKPVFNGTLLAKGTHINSIGSYTPQMQETPEEVLLFADKIFFDDYDAVLNESADVINPLKEGKITEKDFTGEIGDVVKGKYIGRDNDEQITWFKMVGSAVLDLVIAEKIYQKALQQNLGTTIEL